MAEDIDIGEPGAPELMQRTVLDIAERAVATKQITYWAAALGCMYAAYDLFRAAGLSEQVTLSTMRETPDIIARAIEEAKKPRLKL